MEWPWLKLGKFFADTRVVSAKHKTVTQDP